MAKSEKSLSSEQYNNLVLTLEEIDLNLAKAEKELGKIARLRGLGAIDIASAQTEFQTFKKGYEVQKQQLKESAASMKQDEYKKSMFGKLEMFATEWLTKIDKSLGSPGSKIQNNEVSRAVGKVISSACTAIMCTLNHAVATGKLAESVLELGAAIHDKVFNKDEEPEIPEEQPTQSRGKPLDRLDESLDTVSKWLQTAKKDLGEIEKGPQQQKAAEALTKLESFSKEFDTMRKEVTEKTKDVPEALDKYYYEKTWFGAAEQFAKKWLGGIAASKEPGQVMPQPVEPSSKISKAAGKVITSACDVVVSVLNQAVATGKVAESVIDLGKVVRNKVVGQTKATAQMRV